jgi:hypothetical protein
MKQKLMQIFRRAESIVDRIDSFREEKGPKNNSIRKQNYFLVKAMIGVYVSEQARLGMGKTHTKLD